MGKGTNPKDATALSDILLTLNHIIQCAKKLIHRVLSV